MMAVMKHLRGIRRNKILFHVCPSLRYYCKGVEQNKVDEATGKDFENTQQPLVINNQPVVAERVKTRSVLAVSGPDSIMFLNNLTTNELRQLQTDVACVHTFFLNARGRIIHDALIYKPDDDNTLFVECDISSLQALQTHLIMYRAKTNVEIRSVEQEVGVWIVYDPSEIDTATTGSPDGARNVSVKHDTSFLEDLDLCGNVLMSRDPRMWPLGVRILAPKEIDITQVLRMAGVKITNAPNGTYKSVRYKLGVAEGISEIGYGRSLPAEINGDYTNAICLSKTNYTGWVPGGFKRIVENRMLPLKFQGNSSHLTTNSPITDRKGKKRTPIGYLRGVHGSFGLGLLHIPSVVADKYCKIGEVAAEAVSPPWWKTDGKTSEVSQ